MIRQLASIGCCDFMLSHLISMLSHLWKVLSQLVFQEHCVEHRTVASSLHKCRICSPAHGAIIAGVPQAPQPLLLARPCTSATAKLQLTQATKSMKRTTTQRVRMAIPCEPGIHSALLRHTGGTHVK